MKPIYLHGFLALAFMLRGVAGATDYAEFSITADEASDVKQKLEAYEKGRLSLADLNENAGGDGCRRLIGYYLSHTNDLSARAKFPISRCYAGFGLYSDAARLAEEYLKAYPKDSHAWRVLGNCYDLLKSTNESIHAYCKAVKLGDNKSYEPLAGVAIKSDRLDLVCGIVPQLMAVKRSKQTLRDNKLNVISLLLVYSMKADRKDVFIETLEGEDLKELMRDDTIKLDLSSGCELFTGKDIENICREIRASMLGGSKTNAVSKSSR